MTHFLQLPGDKVSALSPTRHYGDIHSAGKSLFPRKFDFLDNVRYFHCLIEYVLLIAN